MQSVSIIIPCLNEEVGLRILLPTIPDFIQEIVLVDNGSHDTSARIAQQYKAKIISEPTKGYGNAILRGIENSVGKIIVIIDGDGSYRLQNLRELCTYMEEKNIDFVSGCRFPLSNSCAMTPLNILANYFISWLGRILFHFQILDLQSGMMIFKRDILNKIKVGNAQMGFSQELKIKAWIHNEIKCCELRIDYHPRAGKVKFRKLRDGMSNLYSLFALWVQVRRSEGDNLFRMQNRYV
jgi:glycosyltransferase involved in cell wall biosynthesis